MEDNPDLDPRPARIPRAPLPPVLGLVVSGLWLAVAGAGFLAFFVWYFYTLEEAAAPPALNVQAPERSLQPLVDAAPSTDILLQTLDTRSRRSLSVLFFGHPLMHCAVRVNPFSDRDAFMILFVRKGENFSISLPRARYQGVLACGSHWDEQDFSFVGVTPKIYRDTDFFWEVQAGRNTGVDLGALWEAERHGQ